MLIINVRRYNNMIARAHAMHRDSILVRHDNQQLKAEHITQCFHGVRLSEFSVCQSGRQCLGKIFGRKRPEFFDNVSSHAAQLWRGETAKVKPLSGISDHREKAVSVGLDGHRAEIVLFQKQVKALLSSVALAVLKIIFFKRQLEDTLNL